MTNTSNQHLFNTAYLGLKSQDFKQSISPSGFCMYRGPDGLKCAIGHCIPDSHYHPDMDNGDLCSSGTGVVSSDFVREVLEDLYPGFNLDLAERLQACHDNNASLASYANLAEDFGLEMPNDA